MLSGGQARALQTPWRAVTLFLLPAATFYIAFTAYPVVRTLWNAFHKVLPAGTGVRRHRQLRRARARRDLLARRPQHAGLGLHLAALRGLDRARAGARPLRQDSRAGASSASPGSRRC
jgi:ABC-type sugar transport system permease subunit